MKKFYSPPSEILMEIAQTKPVNGAVTFRRILQKLGQRSFGIALLFCSLPSVLPVAAIPGVAFFFGVPIILFALQMVIGRKMLWLPKSIADHAISHKKVSKFIFTATPYLVKIEKFLKPRLALMTSHIMEVINGLTIFFLALLLMLPIPFSNFIFSSLIILFSLGIIAKDGLFILIGYVATSLYIVFGYIVVVMAVKNVLNWMT